MTNPRDGKSFDEYGKQLTKEQEFIALVLGCDFEDLNQVEELMRLAAENPKAHRDARRIVELMLQTLRKMYQSYLQSDDTLSWFEGKQDEQAAFVKALTRLTRGD